MRVRLRGLCGAALVAVLFDVSTRGAPVDYWVRRNPVPTSERISAVTFYGEQFVAVGDAGTILTSSNGETWVSRESGVRFPLLEIAAGNGMFVTIGNLPSGDIFQRGFLLASRDGVAWEKVLTGQIAFTHVKFVGGRFVAQQFANGVVTSLISSDGLAWASGNSPAEFPDTKVATGNGLSVGFTTDLLVSRDGGVIWTSKPALPQVAVWSVAYGNGVFTAVGEGLDGFGLPNIYTSSDGTNWTAREAGTAAMLYDIIFANGLFVVAGEGYQLLTSPDGINWARHILTTRDEPGALAFGNGRFVAVGNIGTLLSSTDGTNWVERRAGPATLLEGVTYSAGKFVAVGAPLDPTVKNGPAVLTSTDGVNWSHAGDVELPKDWVGSLPIGTGTLAWPLNQVPGSNHLAAITYGAGMFVAAGDSGILAFSTSATNWSLITSPTTNALRSLIYAAGRFVAVGYKGTILTSSDGFNWKAVDSGFPTAALLGLAYGGGVFVAGAYDTTTSTGFVITSTNGLNWHAAPSSTTPRPYYGVAYGGGQFVAISDRIMSSTNGFDWFKAGGGVEGVSAQAISYADGKFVIVGYGGISYSSDGQHWTNVVLSLSHSTGLLGISYGGGTFVAVGQGGTILQSATLPRPAIIGFHLTGLVSNFSITGAPGLRYRIEASTNLAFNNWIDLGGAASGELSSVFAEQSKTNFSQRFYRARAQ